MHLLGCPAVGVLVLVLSVLQAVIMFFSPGSFRLQRPQGGVISWAYNVLNLLILVIVTPLLGVLLLKEVTGPISTTSIDLGDGVFVRVLESVGLVLYCGGNVILYASRLVLSRSFRLGAVAPRSEDRLVTTGLYQYVRHPMYSAVLAMVLGLTLLVQSLVLFGLFAGLAISIVAMLPVEDAQLERAYRVEYTRYKEQVKALVPFVF